MTGSGCFSFFGSDGSDLLGRMAVGFCTTVPVAYRTFNASSYVELIAITLLSGGAAAADVCRSSCEVELEPAIDLRLGCGVVELEPAPVCACADLSIATRCRYDTFASPLNLGTEPPSGTGTASLELRRLLWRWRRDWRELLGVAAAADDATRARRRHALLSRRRSRATTLREHCTQLPARQQRPAPLIHT